MIIAIRYVPIGSDVPLRGRTCGFFCCVIGPAGGLLGLTCHVGRPEKTSKSELMKKLGQVYFACILNFGTQLTD